MSAFAFAKEWMAGSPRHSIVCSPEDRHEMMAIACLRQRQTLSQEQNVFWLGVMAEDMNGKICVRPMSPLKTNAPGYPPFDE